MKQKRICVLHPEGNIHNNPNLIGIVEILSEKGMSIDVFSPETKNVYQGSNLGDRAHLVLCTNNVVGRLKKYFLLKRQYDFMIGVDTGILEASRIGKLRNIPTGFISYEIMFNDEVSREFKKKEVHACKDLSFAICQDRLRATHLSIQNKIPISKIINIPVAGRGVVPGEKSRYLYSKFQIPSDKKIALFTGGVSKRSMIDELLDSTEKWPHDWVLVIHNRYGMDEKTTNYYNKYKHYQNVYFSQESCNTFQELKLVLKSADIGLALFRPVYDCAFSGKNIQYIGMSSGKIATYLQHGLPIIINQIGEMSDYVKEDSIGFTINNIQKIAKILNDYKSINFYREKCYLFFQDKLDLHRNISPLIERLEI